MERLARLTRINQELMERQQATIQQLQSVEDQAENVIHKHGIVSEIKDRIRMKIQRGPQ